MGDFMGHVLPGTLLLAVGLWRMWSSVARFAADPPEFRVRAWNPVPFPPRLLELHVVAGGSFLDMCVELLYASPRFRAVLTGAGVDVDVDVDDAHHLGGLEHAGMLLMFFLFGALALACEKTRLLRPLPDAALSLVFAGALTAEFLLFRFHRSTTHAGLEGYYHRLLLILLGLCIAAVVAGALLPSSFPADLGAGVLIAVQGMWFYQTGITLYGPMLPAGCVRRFDSPHSDARVECQGGAGAAAQERAEQLADFQLFGAVFVAFVYVLGCYAVAAARYGHRELTTAYDKHVAGTSMELEESTI